MMFVRVATLRHAAVVLLLGATGCGGPYNASVSGIVTLDGQPLHRGTVAYNPVGGGPAGYSVVESDGSYRIRTGREFGISAGDYEVTVVANEAPQQRTTKHGGPPPPGKPITPPWYRSKNTSGLSYTVQPGRNEINIELSSDPPAGWNQQRRRR